MNRPTTNHTGRRVLTSALIVWFVLVATTRQTTAAPAAPLVRVQELSNGLTVVVEERPGALSVGVALVVRAGTRDDRPEKLGEVALLARMLLGGTLSLPSLERLTGAIEATGGEISLRLDPDLTRYSVLVPRGEEATALETLADMLRAPRFGVLDLSRAIEETAAGTYTTLDDGLAAALWPQHPAGRPGSGTAATLDAITFADLMQVQRELFGARNLTLAIVGAVDADRVINQVESAFGTLVPGSRRPETLTVSPAPVGVTRRVLSFSDQASVLIGFATPGSTSPDYPAVRLLYLLLTGPDGLVFQELRSRHGLARDVNTGIIALSDVSALVAAARVQPANVIATVERLRGVFATISDGLDGERLARLQARSLGETLRDDEPARNRAETLAADHARGTPDAADRLRAAINGVTVDDLHRVAAAYLRADRAVIFVNSPEPGQ